MKWGAIQPLTGGMYIGAENAIGNKAEWIISYPGLTKVIKDKEGNITDAANEYHLMQYLKSQNDAPDYYVFDRTMFQNDTDMNPKIYNPETNETVTPDYNNIDLVVAVPVCSGLSVATIASNDLKETRNCNMLWIAKYTLNVIRPKVYIFENAPTLMGSRGVNVRASLENIAKQYGYSIIYYKTDTRLHDNCQKRPRTFIMFIKKSDDGYLMPELQFENKPVSIEDFFNRMTSDPFDNGELPKTAFNDITVDYMQYLYGDNWRSKVKNNIFGFITDDENKTAEFEKWLYKTQPKEDANRFQEYLDHIDKKKMQGKGWWIMTPSIHTDNTPATMHKSMWSTIHHKYNRRYTIREWMFTMGLPNEFKMYGEPLYFFKKIGQNVPVRTAEWIVSEAVRVLNNWDSINRCDNPYVAFYDNIKQKKIS